MFSSDLEFRDLGLLIVDEEQRFGVEHKEQLKKLKANVDVLTLSATPIPRTLYFAMVGVRSFSTIETAPTNRRHIRTEIVKGSDDILKKAIALELRRGGQTFYLHNRVKTIHSVTRRLQSLFPRLRIAVGHGQMGESELEEVMVEFIEGKYDLLICTTIIESGLDIPNCNTIIIEEADKFGLSQLYQLRGRVGRFSRQAYAYLLVNPLLPIKDMARKRLSALRSTSSLGAGFKIALRDLELRGAGNLLGSEQSGHIAGVGFEMYCKLLRESVSRLKGDENALRPAAVVRMDFLHTDDSIIQGKHDAIMASCFPASYISEPRLRIECYRKIASIMKTEEIMIYEEELTDRFGPIPDQTRALLYETEIKCLGQEAGFDSISSKENELYCREVKKSSRDGVKYLKKMGRIPLLNEKLPLLKLKEIIRFLKIHLHGIKDVS
jgi:transcription-repair coupling factor (superfamily II helicase)